MKILVMSDSHGRTKNVHKIIEKEENLDMIIHLGDEYSDFEEIQSVYDITSHGVKGNTDYFCDGPLHKVIELMDKKIFICHGHKYGVKSNLDMLRSLAEENGFDIVLYGHSHVPHIEEKSVFILNPGSISQPRTEPHPSYAILEITDKNIEAEVIYIK